jgi:putative cell wall-binding protein/sugar lactone lactonase YvrE
MAMSRLVIVVSLVVVLLGGNQAPVQAGWSLSSPPLDLLLHPDASFSKTLTLRTLWAPRALTVTSDGRVMVADTGNNRISIFDTLGRPLSSWQVPEVPYYGTTTSAIVRGIAVDGMGSIYLSERSGFRVSRWSPTWQYQGSLVNPTIMNTDPAGISCGPEGDIYVADGNGKVNRFKPDGTVVASWGNESLASGPHTTLTDIAVHRDGTVFVTDVGADKVFVYTSTGELLDTWTGAGTPAEGMKPRAVAVCGGEVFVADPSHGSIHVFSASGSFLRSWGRKGALPGEMETTCDMAFGPDGLLYVLENGVIVSGERVNVFDRDGTCVRWWGANGTHVTPAWDDPLSISLDESGDLYVVGRFRGEAEADTHRFSGDLHVASLRALTYSLKYTAAGGGRNYLVDADPFDPGWVWQSNELCLGRRRWRIPLDSASICADRYGRLYVATRETQQVVRYSVAGTASVGFAPPDGFVAPPTGIAYDTRGKVMVADASSTISVFNEDGVYEASWIACDVGGAPLQIIDVAPDGTGMVFVLDARLRVYAFDGGGCLEGVSSRIHGAQAVEADTGHLYVMTAGFPGILRYTPELREQLPPVTPIAGDNRFDTAVAASEHAYPDGLALDGERTVVIATGRNWPDALGGAALAGALDAPILLVEPTSLPSSTKAEIERLGATHAIILGGTGAVSDAVMAAIDAIGGIEDVERIFGSDRYQTADAVALRTIEVLELGDGYDGTAFVATGANFPDALAAAPLAAAQGWPLFLAHPTAGVLPGTATAMGSVDDAIILGGTGALSASVESALDTLLGGSQYTERLQGVNRYVTAVAIASYGVTDAGHTWDRVGIATGQDYPDALAGGVLQGKVGSVMLLTTPTTLHAATVTALTANAGAIDTVTFFGGTGVVSPAVRAAALAASGIMP